MNILVIYYSLHGNTKDVAYKIAEGIMETDAGATVKESSEVTPDDIRKACAIIIGTPVYFGNMSGALKKDIDDMWELKNELKHKLGAVFATQANPAGGGETAMMSIVHMMLLSGMIVTGTPSEMRAHYGLLITGHLDNQGIFECMEFGRHIADTASKYQC